MTSSRIQPSRRPLKIVLAVLAAVVVVLGVGMLALGAVLGSRSRSAVGGR